MHTVIITYWYVFRLKLRNSVVFELTLLQNFIFLFSVVNYRLHRHTSVLLKRVGSGTSKHIF